MLSGLDSMDGVEIEVISKTRGEFKSEAYRQNGLPPAPALMLDDEVVVQGGPITEEKLRELVAARQSA